MIFHKKIISVIHIFFFIMLTIPLDAKISMPKVPQTVSKIFSGSTKEELIQKEFLDITDLELFCDHGNITIHSWKQPSLIIEVTKQGTATQLAHTSLEISQEEQLLQIQTKLHESKSIATTNMNIIVPENTNLKIATNEGNIYIKNVHGTTYAQSNKGAIDSIDNTVNTRLKTTHGNITIQQPTIVSNATLYASTEHGSITLQVPQYINCNLEATTKSGKVYSDLFITLQPLRTKLHDKSYKLIQQEVRGTITKSNVSETTGNIKLKSDLGMIKIKSYLS